MNLLSNTQGVLGKSAALARSLSTLLRDKVLSNPLFLKLARALGALLTLASIALIFRRGWGEVGFERWAAMGNALIFSTVLYGLSFNLQAWMWGLLMNRYAGVPYGWRDAEVYALSNLLRNTPGVVWYLLERVESYKKDGVQGRKTLIASSAEWVNLVLAAPIAYAIGWALHHDRLGWSAAIILFVLMLAALWQLGKRQSALTSQWLGILPFILLVYVLCYLLGAGLTYITAIAVEPQTSLTLPITIELYALMGGFIFLSTVIIPLSFGMREFSLTYLLSPYTGLESAITVAAMLRIIFLGSDLIFSFLLWRVARYAQQRQYPPNIG